MPSRNPFRYPPGIPDECKDGRNNKSTSPKRKKSTKNRGQFPRQSMPLYASSQLTNRKADWDFDIRAFMAKSAKKGVDYRTPSMMGFEKFKADRQPSRPRLRNDFDVHLSQITARMVEIDKSLKTGPTLATSVRTVPSMKINYSGAVSSKVIRNTKEGPSGFSSEYSDTPSPTPSQPFHMDLLGPQYDFQSQYFDTERSVIWTEAEDNVALDPPVSVEQMFNRAFESCHRSVQPLSVSQNSDPSSLQNGSYSPHLKNVTDKCIGTKWWHKVPQFQSPLSVKEYVSVASQTNDGSNTNSEQQNKNISPTRNADVRECQSVYETPARPAPVVSPWSKGTPLKFLDD